MDDNMIRISPPHSIEAERAVIGSMLMRRDAITEACELITGNDFYSRKYGLIFEAIVALDSEGDPVDVVTLQNKLKEMNVSGEIASIETLTDILDSLITSANVKHYCKIVVDKALLRRIYDYCQELGKECLLENRPVEELSEEAHKKIFDIVKSGKAGNIVPIRSAVKEVIHEIGEAAKNHGPVGGISTGFTKLDEMTAGFQPSDLILIAARPSMGKTAFVLNIVQYICFHENLPIAVFSLEMPQRQLVKRLLSLETHVDAEKLRNGNISSGEWEDIIEGASVIGEANLFIDDTSGITVTDLCAKCRKLKAEHDIQMVIIDYLQLLTSKKKSDNKVNEVSDISRTLKMLAREINVPVVALSQLNRSVERRDDKRPIMSDLRDSGSIEQDADVVMFLYREDYYNKQTERKGISELIIAKQRNGPVGTVDLAWIPQLTKFANLAAKTDE